MNLFVIFLLIFSNSYSSSSPSDSLDKYLDYLSSRGVIDESHISFVRNTALTKRDSFFYFYKILKILDEEKANLDDVKVIESVVADISEYINNLRETAMESEKSISNYSKELIELKLEISALEKKREEMDKALKRLKYRVDRSIDSETNRFKKFIKDFEINANVKGFVEVDAGEQSFLYEAGLKLSKEWFSISYYSSNFMKPYLFSFDMETRIGILQFSSPNCRKAFVSNRREIFYSTVEGGVADKTLIGIENKHLDLFLFKGAEGLDLLSRIRGPRIELLALVELSNRNFRFVEANFKIPVSASLVFGPGTTLRNNKFESIEFFANFLSDNVVVKMSYSHSVTGGEILLSPYFSYKLDDFNTAAASLDWALKSVEMPLKNWKFLFKSLVSAFKVDVLVGAEDVSSLYFGLKGAFQGSKLGIESFFFLKSGEEKKYDVSFLFELFIPLEDMTKIFFRYYNSSFDFANNNFDFEGGLFSLNSWDGEMGKTGQLGVISMGLNIEV